MPFSLSAKPPKPKKPKKEKVIVRSSGRGGSGNIKRKKVVPNPTPPALPARSAQTSTRTNEGSQSNIDVNAGELASITSASGGSSSARHPTSSNSATGSNSGYGIGDAPSSNSLNRVPTAATANSAHTANTNTGSSGHTTIPDAGEAEDRIKAPTGREILSAKHRKLYSGRGGAGNAHKLLADDKVYERVLLHEQGIVQSYKEERKAREGKSTGRGGAGNIKKKKSALSNSSSSVRTGSSSGRSWGSIVGRRNRSNSSTPAFGSTAVGTSMMNTITTTGTIETVGITTVTNSTISLSPIPSLQALPSNDFGSPLSSALLEQRVFERLDEVNESDLAIAEESWNRSASALGFVSPGAGPSNAVNMGRQPMTSSSNSTSLGVGVGVGMGLGGGGGSSTTIASGHSSHCVVPNSATANSNPSQKYPSQQQSPSTRQTAAKPIALASGSWIANNLQEPTSYSRPHHYVSTTSAAATPPGSSGSGTSATRMGKNPVRTPSPLTGPFSSTENVIVIGTTTSSRGKNVASPNQNQNTMGPSQWRYNNEVMDISMSPGTTPVASSGMIKRSGSENALNNISLSSSQSQSQSQANLNPTIVVLSDDQNATLRARPRESSLTANASNRSVAIYGPGPGQHPYRPGTDPGFHGGFPSSNDDLLAIYSAYDADPAYVSHLPYLNPAQSSTPPSPSQSSHSNSGSGSRASSRQAQPLAYPAPLRPLPSSPPPSISSHSHSATGPTQLQRATSKATLTTPPLGPAEATRHSSHMSNSSNSEFGSELDLSKYNFPDAPGHRPVHARNERDMPSLHMVVEAASPAESMMSSQRAPASSVSHHPQSQSPSQFRPDLLSLPPPPSHSPPRPPQPSRIPSRAPVQPGAYQAALRSAMEDVPLPDAPPPLYQPRASKRYHVDPTLRYDRYDRYDQDSEYAEDAPDLQDGQDGQDPEYSSYSESTLATPSSYSPRRVASPNVRPSRHGGNNIGVDPNGYGNGHGHGPGYGRPHLRMAGSASPLSEVYTPIEESHLERLPPSQESRNEKERFAPERYVESRNEKSTYANNRQPQPQPQPQHRNHVTRSATDPYQRVLAAAGTPPTIKLPAKPSSPAPVKPRSSSHLNSPKRTTLSPPSTPTYAQRFPAPESPMSSSPLEESPHDSPFREPKDKERSRPTSQAYSTYTRSNRYSTWGASQATATAVDHHDHDFPAGMGMGMTLGGLGEDEGKLDRNSHMDGDRDLDRDRDQDQHLNDVDDDDDGTHFYTSILGDLDSSAVPSPTATLTGDKYESERGRMKEKDALAIASRNMRMSPIHGYGNGHGHPHGGNSPKEPTWLQPGFTGPPLPQIPKHLQANLNSSNKASLDSNSRNHLDPAHTSMRHLDKPDTPEPITNSRSPSRQLPMPPNNNPTNINSGTNVDSHSNKLSEDISSVGTPPPSAHHQKDGSGTLPNSYFPGGMGWDELNRPVPRKLSRMEKALLRRVEFGAVAAADIASIPLA